jgi:UDP-N-acetylmuramoylalanine--D-glutamate ligase
MANINVLAGLRVVVVGLGREGIALATWLANHGIPVIATDSQTKEKIGQNAIALESAGVELVVGGHPDALLDRADILFVSPGIPLELPFLQQAQRRKIPLSSESRLFCHLCPARIVGITGSSGKTTTTTLVGKMLAAAGRTTWVGGNIGRPLIEVVDQIQPDDAVVMELSSFQLEYFHARLNKNVDFTALPGPDPARLAQLLGHWSPPIGAILNITPNHLDRHPSMKAYVRAKRAIINYQQPDDVAVMGLDDDMTRTIGNQYSQRVRWFSLEAEPPNGAGLYRNDLVLLDAEGRPQLIAHRQEVLLRGMHNLSNILAASLLAQAAGVSLEAIRQVSTTFAGVEHRLQLVGQHRQVLYYNDSIATSPERLMAAIRSFTEPMILLAGGRDKHLPWDYAARLILTRVKHLLVFGEAAELIGEAVAEARREMPDSPTEVTRCEGLAEAVQLAARLAAPGEVVLLSPGCTSYDAFASFVERGHRFAELVAQL